MKATEQLEALLGRLDNRRFLRAVDVQDGGRDDCWSDIAAGRRFLRTRDTSLFADLRGFLGLGLFPRSTQAFPFCKLESKL